MSERLSGGGAVDAQWGGSEAPALAAVPAPPRPAIRPLPAERLQGPGRDRSFGLPQYQVELNGLRTAYFDAGRGPTLFFIHGLAGNVTHWVHLAPVLADRYRVVGLDLPGCGESERPAGELSVSLCAEQALSLMDALGLRRVTLVGHSLGGMVAAELGLRWPGRVERAVLVNPAGFQKLPLPLRGAGHLLLRQSILDPLLPRVWRNILDLVFDQPNDTTRAFVRSVRATYRDEDVHQLSDVMAALKHDFLDRDFLDVLERLRLPVAMVWGERDRLTPARALRAAAARLPNVTAREIPACGHLPIFECPEILLAVLAEVLGN